MPVTYEQSETRQKKTVTIKGVFNSQDKIPLGRVGDYSTPNYLAKTKEKYAAKTTSHAKNRNFNPGTAQESYGSNSYKEYSPFDKTLMNRTNYL